MLADTDATLAAVPSWMKELSNIIGLQLDLMASMQSSQASEIEASKASIKGGRDCRLQGQLAMRKLFATK
eukprot:symbB.v1.2.035234.t1/scaffold4696.1/size81176/8